MSLDERFSSALEELDMAFADTDVPPARHVAKRHRRGRALQASIVGIAAIGLALGIGALVASDDDGPETDVVAVDDVGALLRTWRIDRATVDGNEIAVPEGTWLRFGPESGPCAEAPYNLQDPNAAELGSTCTWYVPPLGCNRGSGVAAITADTLTFGPAMSTLIGCSPDEQPFDLGATPHTWRLDGDDLTLTSADGRVLELHAVAEGVLGDVAALPPDGPALSEVAISASVDGYEPNRIEVTTGIHRIVLTSTDSEHTLAFDDTQTMFPGLLVTEEGARDSARAFFGNPGEYVFFDTVPSNRTDGREGVIVVTGEPKTLEQALAELDDETPATTSLTATSQPPSDITPSTDLVGATDDGRIVEITRTGEVGLVITRVPDDADVAELQIVGGDLWYLDVGGDTNRYCGAVHRVPITGGTDVVVVEQTTTFAVAADGGRIAYALNAGCGRQETGAEFVMTDVATGEVHRWRTPTAEETEDFFDIGSIVSEIAWSPDGTQVAVAWCYEGCGVDIYDADSDGTFPSDTIAGGEHPTWIGATLWAAQVYYPEPFDEPLVLKRLDPGQEWLEVASPFAERPVDLIAAPDGTLVGVFADGADVPSRLAAWDLTGVATTVGLEAGVVAVAAAPAT